MILKKYLLASLILIISAITVNAQNIKYLESTMVRVVDTFYVCKYEVTNAEYREFLEANKNAEFQPDTNTWQLVRDKVIPFEGNYFTDAKYNRYPIVCIHPHQAMQYCEWLTKRYNKAAGRKYKTVKFRLPTEAEWLQVARGAEGEDTWFPWKGNSLRQNDTKRMANYMNIEDACLKSDMFSAHVDFLCLDEAMKKCFIEAVTTYGQTPFGVHNICGNAAEMVMDRTYAKGGSWLSSGYYLRLDITDNEQLPVPSPMVGFRWVMDVLEQ